MEESKNNDIEKNVSSKANSLSAEAWRKLKKNRYAMAGLYVIAFAFVVAILGSFIRPDVSVDADEKIDEIGIKKPGFKVNMLAIKENKTIEGGWFGTRLFFGGKDDGIKRRPFHSYSYEDDEIVIEKFSKFYGDDDYEPIYLRFSLADVAFNLSDQNIYTNNLDGTVSFHTRADGKITRNINDLKAMIEDNHVYSQRYFLGTDIYGRDMLSRLMGGTIISLSVGMIAVLISLIIGITLGAVAGYYRGWVDEIIMWFINVIWSVPALLLVIAITIVLGKGFDKVFIAVGLTMWVEVARVVRGQVLSVREKEYIEAGKALGYKSSRIIFRHVLPNITGPIIVIAAANFASAILIEAGLSFLGIGTQIPTPSWGGMIEQHKGYITNDAAYLVLLPSICIIIMVLAFMLVGNGLRDALDTKSVDS